MLVCETKLMRGDIGRNLSFQFCFLKVISKVLFLSHTVCYVPFDKMINIGILVIYYMLYLNI